MIILHSQNQVYGYANLGFYHLLRVTAVKVFIDNTHQCPGDSKQPAYNVSLVALMKINIKNKHRCLVTKIA